MASVLYAEAFWTIWKLAQEQGLCDQEDSEEAARVWKEWVIAGGPIDILQFIRQHANALSVGKREKQGESLNRQT